MPFALWRELITCNYQQALARFSFGETWLARGTVQVQFVKPIYEGDQVTVTGTVNAVSEAQLSFALASTNAEGVACGVGTAALLATVGTPPDPVEVPAGPLQAARVPVSWEAVVVGQPLPVLTINVSQEDNEAYCHTHADDLAIYRDAMGVVHPGLLLRQCNRSFSEHFISMAR